MHGREMFAFCAKSLKDLKLDYLDLYLVHWPFRNYHAPGLELILVIQCQPYNHEIHMEAWYQMERLMEAGLVRHIGTSI